MNWNLCAWFSNNKATLKVYSCILVGDSQSLASVDCNFTSLSAETSPGMYLQTEALLLRCNNFTCNKMQFHRWVCCWIKTAMVVQPFNSGKAHQLCSEWNSVWERVKPHLWYIYIFYFFWDRRPNRANATPLVYWKRCIYNCGTFCRDNTPVISNNMDFWILQTEISMCYRPFYCRKKCCWL